MQFGLSWSAVNGSIGKFVGKECSSEPFLLNLVADKSARFQEELILWSSVENPIVTFVDE